MSRRKPPTELQIIQTLSDAELEALAERTTLREVARELQNRGDGS